MNILDTHIHKLCFKIKDYDLEDIIKSKWKILKNKCETGDNEDITQMILNNLQTENNTNMQILKNSCGGFSINDKEITFKHCGTKNNFMCDYGFSSFSGDNNDNDNNHNDNNDNDILLDVANSQNEKFTYEELDDISFAFVKMAYQFTNANFICGLQLVALNLRV